MDTSETYIKMCEKAEEIQEAWQPETPDFVVLRGCKEVDVVGKREFKEVRVPEDVWLPRQDQLQEMVSSSPGVLIDNFNNWFQELSVNTPVISWDKIYFNSSMEQLWLAFDMKQMFNKIWNGEDWV